MLPNTPKHNTDGSVNKLVTVFAGNVNASPLKTGG